VDTVIGIGSNVGESRLTLSSAVEQLATLGEVARVSSLYETDPVGPPQPVFLNAAVRLQTDLPPLELLDQLLAIERAHGRLRRERWGPRTLDLDILWAADLAFEHPRLSIPHAELTRRAFALVPLLDVASDGFDPPTGRTYRAILDALGDASVRRVAGEGWQLRDSRSPR
jgi:2-amino-4-hydroxy-6-hydroxymethyldihydropteridine diphosphokinase